MERVWGGRALETEFNKPLPPAVRVGESWEMVDRPEAQSVVHDGAFRGQTLHELWTKHRREIFGDIVSKAERFPLFIKLLDAQEALSVQVHPPADIAGELGGEPKTEFWYIAATKPGAELFVGLNQRMTRAMFEEALRKGTVAEYLHRLEVRAGDSMFMPSGRIHAIGAGSVVVEVQQNSDTTYRLFDWNRAEAGGKRKLHIEESLRCINYKDVRPKLNRVKTEALVRHELFEVDKWKLRTARPAAGRNDFAIICCVTGAVKCADLTASPGDIFLVPAMLADKSVAPAAAETTLLRIGIGGGKKP